MHIYICKCLLLHLLTEVSISIDRLEHKVLNLLFYFTIGFLNLTNISMLNRLQHIYIFITYVNIYLIMQFGRFLKSKVDLNVI